MFEYPLMESFCVSSLWYSIFLFAGASQRVRSGQKPLKLQRLHDAKILYVVYIGSKNYVRYMRQCRRLRCWHSLSAETIGTTMHPTRLVGLAELMVVGRGGVHAVLTSGATNHDLEGASVLNAISDPMGRSPICSAYGIKGPSVKVANISNML